MDYKELKEKILDRYNVSIPKKEKYSRGENCILTCNICNYTWEWRLRYDRTVKCPSCYPTSSSRGEWELYDLLATSGLNIIHNDRQALNGKELDIYFPDFNFAIEYDGNYWHNEEDDKIKNKLCENLGIDLIRIKDEDFIEQKEKTIKYILDYFTSKYKKIEIHPELVKTVVRTSGKCRKIICTDNMVVYNSYLHAMKDLKCDNIRNLLNACRTKTTCKGWHVQYFNSNKTYIKTQREYSYKNKHIKCIETNEVFISINELQKNGVTAIWDCLNGRQKTACGLHWEYTDLPYTEYTKTIELIKKHNGNSGSVANQKKVICLETKKIYNSAKDAEKELQCAYNSINRVCRGVQKTAGKFHWKYLENYKEELTSKT